MKKVMQSINGESIKRCQRMGCMHPTAGYGFVLLVLFHADIPAGMAANDWPCDVQSSFLVYIKLQIKNWETLRIE